MSRSPTSLRPVDQQELSPGARRKLVIVSVGVFALFVFGLLWWLIGTSDTVSEQPTVSRPTAQQNQEPETPMAIAEVHDLGTLSTSHELSVIEADVESTRLRNLNAEFNAIEATLRIE